MAVNEIEPETIPATRRGRGAVSQKQLDSLAESMLRDKERLELGTLCWSLHRMQGMRQRDILEHLQREYPDCPVNSVPAISKYILAYEQVGMQVNPRYSLDALKLMVYAQVGELRRLVTQIWATKAPKISAKMSKAALAAMMRTTLSEHSKHSATAVYLQQIANCMDRIIRMEGYKIGPDNRGGDETISKDAARAVTAALAKAGGGNVEIEETRRTIKMHPTEEIIEGDVVDVGKEEEAAGASGGTTGGVESHA